MKSLPRSALAVIFVFAFVLSAALKPTNACGPFSRYAIFSYTKHPDLPLERYSGGDLGILQSSYARSYLYVAYRLMNGGKFGKDAQEALTSLWNERLDFSVANKDEDATPEWIAARKRVMGVSADPKLEVFRAKGKDEYDSFLNCHSDAFRTAARTLEQRIAKYGALSREVKEWTQAQDQVFSNCGGGQTIPEQTPSSDPLLKADRAYQIAAAQFYSMSFDNARVHFEKIARDNASPWREQSQYLVARSLIRKASLGDPASREASLTEAETVLKSVLSANMSGSLHKSAEGLLDLVELRLRPDARLRGLAQSLVESEANSNLKQDVVDYTLLLDKYTGDSDQPLDKDLKKAIDASEKDDLTDWLITFQSEDSSSLAHSIDRWEKSHSTAWLIACLSKLDGNNAKASSLMSEAERLGRGAPAFVTAQFHLIRLLIEKGDQAVAAGKLDSLLQSESTLPPSAANHFRHQRMTLAKELDDFLKYAVRQPAAFSWDDDGRQTPIDIKNDDELKTWAGRWLLDVDSTTILNERFPLSLLRRAAMSSALPDHVRRQIALAVWSRAVILDDVATGKAIAPVAATLAPELKTYLNNYLSASTRDTRLSEGLYALLKFPGLRPFIDSSTGRLSPLGERDIYRDNWWCEMSDTTSTRKDASDDQEDGSDKNTVKTTTPTTLQFLSDAQAAAAKRELSKLISLGTAPNYFARETIEWANRAPKDPRIPEALHLVVTSTRYGCTDKESPKWSKAAFDLLHKRYPQSIWAKKTPYWFKDV